MIVIFLPSIKNVQSFVQELIGTVFSIDVSRNRTNQICQLKIKCNWISQQGMEFFCSLGFNFQRIIRAAFMSDDWKYVAISRYVSEWLYWRYIRRTDIYFCSVFISKYSQNFKDDIVYILPSINNLQTVVVRKHTWAERFI
jgi:hypothetical protein